MKLDITALSFLTRIITFAGFLGGVILVAALTSMDTYQDNLITESPPTDALDSGDRKGLHAREQFESVNFDLACGWHPVYSFRYPNDDHAPSDFAKGYEIELEETRRINSIQQDSLAQLGRHVIALKDALETVQNRLGHTLTQQQKLESSIDSIRRSETQLPDSISLPQPISGSGDLEHPLAL